MSLANLIRERRSIRKNNSLPVPQELIMTLLQRAEQLCPYEGEARWRYVYAGTREAKERLVDYMCAKLLENKMSKLIPAKLIASLKNRYIQVPAQLVVIAETDPDRVKNDEIYGTVCSIIQNLQLLGWERQLGMLWGTESLFQNDLFYNGIGLREGERFVGVFMIGYYDKAPRGRSRTPAERKWSVL